MKAYLLIFDREIFDPINLHEFIKSSDLIINWWHYLKSCYILVSFSSVNEISEAIRNNFPKQRFLLVETNLGKSNGWLPKEAWEWITKYSLQ